MSQTFVASRWKKVVSWVVFTGFGFGFVWVMYSLGLGASCSGQVSWSGYASEVITIEGKSYSVWIADTGPKQYRGLSGVCSYDNLQGKDGMVFVYPWDTNPSFVNRGTYVDLDLVWLGSDGQVSWDRLDSLYTTKGIQQIKSSPFPVDRVVELVRK